jgi:zinc transporter ZupT
MNFWQYVLLFAGVLMGGAGALAFRQQAQLLKLLQSFSGAYIFGIIVLHLLPEVYADSKNTQIGFWILGGFFIQILLEQLTHGVEHGHLELPNSKNKSSSLAWQVLFGLSIHALIEGVPLNGQGVGEPSHLLWSVLLHKIPESFALILLLRANGFSPRMILGSLLFFSFMSPLGAWLGAAAHLDEQSITALTALVIGTLLHIATAILFEHEHENGKSSARWRKVLVIVAGVALAIMTT